MHRIKHITNHFAIKYNDNISLNQKRCAQNQQLGLGKKVALIGSGLIGRNWAVLFARAGYTVQMYDISSSQLQAAMDDLKKFRIPLMDKYDMLFGSSPDDTYSRISTTTNISEALNNAILVQEGVPENIELKQKVFATIGNTLNKLNNNNCIISSSASTIVPSILNKKMNYLKENLIVSHPVNPPMAIPVIEICPSPETDRNIINSTKNIMKSIGLKPCTMKKEANGFIVNRLQYALLQAAYQIYEEGIASASDIDECIKNGLATRWSFMGPFETIHLNAPGGVNDYCNRYVEACIHPVLSKIFKNNGNTKWTPEIWEKIHNEMDKNFCKTNKIKQKCEWRDNRLLELAVHKREQDKKDQKL